MVAHQSLSGRSAMQSSAAGSTAAVGALGTVSGLPAPSMKLTSTLIVLPASEGMSV